MANVRHHADGLGRGVRRRGSCSCACLGLLDVSAGTLLLGLSGDDMSVLTCSPLFFASQGKVTTMVRAGASHAIRHFGLKDMQYTTDRGTNLTLKYDESDVRFSDDVCVPVAAGCVVHLAEKLVLQVFLFSGRRRRR